MTVALSLIHFLAQAAQEGSRTIDFVSLGTLMGAIGGAVAAVTQLVKTSRGMPSRKIQDGLSLVDGTEKLIDLYESGMAQLRLQQDALQVQVEGFSRKVDHLERVVDRQRRGITILIRQLRALGATPEWEPSEESA